MADQGDGKGTKGEGTKGTTGEDIKGQCEFYPGGTATKGADTGAVVKTEAANVPGTSVYPSWLWSLEEDTARITHHLERLEQRVVILEIENGRKTEQMVTLMQAFWRWFSDNPRGLPPSKATKGDDRGTKGDGDFYSGGDAAKVAETGDLDQGDDKGTMGEGTMGEGDLYPGGDAAKASDTNELDEGDGKGTKGKGIKGEGDFYPGGDAAMVADTGDCDMGVGKGTKVEGTKGDGDFYSGGDAAKGNDKGTKGEGTEGEGAFYPGGDAAKVPDTTPRSVATLSQGRALEKQVDLEEHPIWWAMGFRSHEEYQCAACKEGELSRLHHGPWTDDEWDTWRSMENAYDSEPLLRRLKRWWEENQWKRCRELFKQRWPDGDWDCVFQLR